MYQLDESPEYYRRLEAQAREAAATAHSHNMRQMQLELADTYKSLAERALIQAAPPSPTNAVTHSLAF
jgi:hypothetical protein